MTTHISRLSWPKQDSNISFLPITTSFFSLTLALNNGAFCSSLKTQCFFTYHRSSIFFERFSHHLHGRCPFIFPELGDVKCCVSTTSCKSCISKYMADSQQTVDCDAFGKQRNRLSITKALEMDSTKSTKQFPCGLFCQWFVSQGN